jgi:hypothetical protein
MAYYDTALRLDPSLDSQWIVTAAACVVIANKFFERDDHVRTGTISDIVRTMNTNSVKQRYAPNKSLIMTIDQVCKREIEILQLLDWNLNIVTPYSFIKNYLSQGIVLSTDKISLRGIEGEMGTGLEPQITTVYRQPGKKTLQKLKRITVEFCDDFVRHTEKFSGLTPEVVAISIVLRARWLCKIEDSVQQIEHMFGRLIDETILGCLSILEQLVTGSATDLLLKTPRVAPHPRVQSQCCDYLTASTLLRSEKSKSQLQTIQHSRKPSSIIHESLAVSSNKLTAHDKMKRYDLQRKRNESRCGDQMVP